MAVYLASRTPRSPVPNHMSRRQSELAMYPAVGAGLGQTMCWFLELICMRRDRPTEDGQQSLLAGSDTVRCAYPAVPPSPCLSMQSIRLGRLVLDSVPLFLWFSGSVSLCSRTCMRLPRWTRGSPPPHGRLGTGRGQGEVTMAKRIGSSETRWERGPRRTWKGPKNGCGRKRACAPLTRSSWRTSPRAGRCTAAGPRGARCLSM